MVLRYLMVIEAVHLQPALFAHILTPPAGAAELRHSRTPAPVQAWIQTLPTWLTIRPPRVPPDATLSR